MDHSASKTQTKSTITSSAPSANSMANAANSNTQIPKQGQTPGLGTVDLSHRLGRFGEIIPRGQPLATNTVVEPGPLNTHQSFWSHWKMALKLNCPQRGIRTNPKRYVYSLLSWISLRRGLYKHITEFDYYRRPNAPYIKGHQTDQTLQSLDYYSYSRQIWI